MADASVPRWSRECRLAFASDTKSLKLLGGLLSDHGKADRDLQHERGIALLVRDSPFCACPFDHDVEIRRVTGCLASGFCVPRSGTDRAVRRPV